MWKFVGLNAMHFQRMQFQNKYVQPVKNQRVCNTILRGFAAKSNFKKIQEM